MKLESEMTPEEFVESVMPLYSLMGADELRQLMLRCYTAGKSLVKPNWHTMDEPFPEGKPVLLRLNCVPEPVYVVARFVRYVVGYDWFDNWSGKVIDYNLVNGWIELEFI